MNIDQILKNYIETKDYSGFENYIHNNSFSKMKYFVFEQWMNTLLATNKSEWIRIINAYYSILVQGSPTQFLHIEMPYKVTGTSKDLIQNYKFINMYNNFIDCSRLLANWSPTQSYFPFLLFVERTKPEKAIDYIPWLKRFSELPTALKFLKENQIKIEFQDPKDLEHLYRTIPQQYVRDFVSLLGNKSWYMDTIRDTDHFLEEL